VRGDRERERVRERESSRKSKKEAEGEEIRKRVVVLSSRFSTVFDKSYRSCPAVSHTDN